MSSHDPARVLRDYTLEPLRRELCQPGGRRLVVINGADVGRLAEAGSCSCDGAWIELESLEGIELRTLASGIARALRPGGRLVCVVPATLRGPTGAPTRVGFGAWRRAFEPAIRWRRASAFGVLVPSAGAWSHRHPLTVGLLAMAEHVMRGWPIVRALGDWVLHEGARR